MAGIKISALPAVASALTTDYFPVVQGGVTSRETVAQVQTLFGFTGGILALANGGTNANLTAALGAVPYSTATAFALLAPGTTGQLFRSGGAGAPTWTTSTYPATNAVSTLLYASSANVMAALPTAASGALVTSAGGVPSISTVLPGGMTTTDPTLTQGIATKNYVDQTALNGTSVYAASAASLGTVTQAGAGAGATLTNAGVQATFALDGVNPPVGSSVLIKDTAVGMTAANEGIYTVTSVGSGATNWVLTRSTTYDTATEINMTGLILVNNGSTLAGTAWYNAATIVTVDTTNFSYSQFGNIIFPITLANGGTSASLTASDGGIFYSTATAGAILSGTATAQQLLMSGSSTAPIWSTSTYPTTNAINTLLYASSANVMAALATANNGVLVTSAGGVPSISSTLPTDIAVTTPKITTGIKDSNADLILGFTAGGGTIANYVNLANTNTTFGPLISAVGTDANIILRLGGKGTGGVAVGGTSTNDSAATGFVGEYVSSVVLVGSPVSLVTSTSKTITSISLTAGDWDVWGDFGATGAGTTVLQSIIGGISLVNNTLPTAAADNATIHQSGTVSFTIGASNLPYYNLTPARISIAATTTVYLVMNVTFITSTADGYGKIVARRVR